MTTIINSPPAQASAPVDGGSGLTGILVGVVIIAIIGFLFFVYGLPATRNAGNANTGSDGPTINVPDKVQVEIKQ